MSPVPRHHDQTDDSYWKSVEMFEQNFQCWRNFPFLSRLRESMALIHDSHQVSETSHFMFVCAANPCMSLSWCVCVCVSLSVDPKPQEKRRPPHHRSILRSPGNSHTPSRPPLSPPSSSSSSSSSVCAAGPCPLPATVSMTGLYSLQSPSLSTLLPSLQALPRPRLLSKLSPLLLQGLPPATNTPTGPTQDWI